MPLPPAMISALIRITPLISLRYVKKQKENFQRKSLPIYFVRFLWVIYMSFNKDFYFTSYSSGIINKNNRCYNKTTRYLLESYKNKKLNVMYLYLIEKEVEIWRT